MTSPSSGSQATPGHFRDKLSPGLFEHQIIFAAVREQRGVKLAA
jgi:uncharacterized membrane protein YphA (DoxX/SURF4 family)